MHGGGGWGVVMPSSGESGNYVSETTYQKNEKEEFQLIFEFILNGLLLFLSLSLLIFFSQRNFSDKIITTIINYNSLIIIPKEGM